MCSLLILAASVLVLVSAAPTENQEIIKKKKRSNLGIFQIVLLRHELSKFLRNKFSPHRSKIYHGLFRLKLPYLSFSSEYNVPSVIVILIPLLDYTIPLQFFDTFLQLQRSEFCMLEFRKK